MTNFSDPYLIVRLPSALPTFYQQDIEINACKTVIKINGETINIIIPLVGITGVPASLVYRNGVYER